MTIRVRLFAVARHLAGREIVDVRVPETARVADVRRQLAVVVPSLADLVDQMMFAVDAEYANDQTPVHATSDVACIPPVSGG